MSGVGPVGDDVRNGLAPDNTAPGRPLPARVAVGAVVGHELGQFAARLMASARLLPETELRGVLAPGQASVRPASRSAAAGSR
jgi:hypothetical protein